MTHDQARKATLTFVVILFAVSALGYLLIPAAMLGIVGIASTPDTEFLVRTLAAALVALIPGAWSVRTKHNPSLSRSVMLGLAVYMFVSSAVDLHASLNQVVNNAAIPSVVLRVALGGVLLWLAPVSASVATKPPE